ncbi:hypothetical protein [Methylobacterium haplocladii]|uniref:Uncharacterized protein n=1 Tax=Methylobacterium haplocladii TaxID=1176176 RepID=A0A512IVZ0_9HYPH|nr:hypothetical protein [Methylobacterium haplocladii]GEP01855.1 hypothetical protein MHA02_42420 [Methylobacterium haplocladii]GJD83146.1 hypothetical protein HPGCJGGD_1009 [Methylobacterium haplocladii]GLS61504.1 hypothetical protein GCM10007887_42180 [Methylobacterium haplocladii]
MTTFDWLRAIFETDIAVDRPRLSILEQVTTRVFEIETMAMPNKFEGDQSFTASLWRKLWLGVYLLEDPRSDTPPDHPTPQAWRAQLPSSWPGFRPECGDARSPFDAHAAALLDGVHPWGAILTASGTLPAEVLRAAIVHKAARLTRGEHETISGPRILALMRHHCANV